jgi:hypothetical protein
VQLLDEVRRFARVLLVLDGDEDGRGAPFPAGFDRLPVHS